MPWTVQTSPHETFARNTLVLVVAQVRFHPILKIPERVGDFQEHVRNLFPAFDQEQARTLDIRDFVNVRVDTEQMFRFSRPSDQARVILTRGSLALEYRNYQSRDELRRDFQAAWHALSQTHGHIQPTRVGVRYINVIHRDRVAQDLGREVGWDELVHKSCLTAPGFDALDDDMLFSGEVAGPVPDGGAMTLRYGRLLNPGPARTVGFRIDVDRYQEAGDTPLDPVELIRAFPGDVYPTFRRFVGPALDEWMRQA